MEGKTYDDAKCSSDDSKARLCPSKPFNDGIDGFQHDNNTLSKNNECQQSHALYQMRLLKAYGLPNARCYDSCSNLECGHRIPAQVRLLLRGLLETPKHLDVSQSASVQPQHKRKSLTPKYTPAEMNITIAWIAVGITAFLLERP